MIPVIQDLRRPVPEDFTPEQRASFAVFSGSGVQRLRRLLWSLAAGADAAQDAEF